MKTTLFFIVLLFSIGQAFAQDDLDNYINRLKKSQATGGSETAFMSAGSDFMYGQDYFEAKSYDMAAMYFARAQKADSANPYFNYQLAIALLKQNDQYKAQEAQLYLQKAFALNASLKKRFAAGVPQATNTNPIKQVAQTENKVPAENKKVTAQGLKAYIEELKYSRATSGPKTAMFTSGQEVMYGWDYYEAGDYASAEQRFWFAVQKGGEDIYANYLLGVSLAAQGKEASQYLARAFTGDAQLKELYNKDVAAAKTIYQQKEAAKKPVVKAAEPKKIGGKLTFGNYVCKQIVWNGPNANPQFSYKPEGYFRLKADGTYRWLDDGPTGRYSYDPKTGNIKWLSGYLAGFTIPSSVFQPNAKVSQITISFSDTYRWECGCNK
jgi:hypothetical protein